LLVVGLGNPGGEYRGTRHNVGFEVVDRLAERNRIRLSEARFTAKFGVGVVDGAPLALAKPLTFMNRCGPAVAALLRHFGLGPADLLVVADELDHVPGVLSMRPKGGAGGHNGHRSLIQALGTNEYARIKIGVGKPPREGVEHVLGRFHPDERERVEPCIVRACEAAEAFAREGLDAALRVANG
jgi:PTH1 family peptidyl-tRNA hydrolase